MTELYRKDLYVNPNIMFLFNKEIIEYDMREAGYSLVKEYELLDESRIATLKNLDKHSRHVKIGKFQKADKDFNKSLKNAFVDIRRRFFESNSIDDSDILSIKKDAIFVLRHCENNTFGNHVEFREKHRYTSYIRLPTGVELYYQNGTIDVKNISDETVRLHEDGIMEFLRTMFRVIETEPQQTQIRILMRYLNKYKRLELPLEYYREFNNLSKYIEKDLESGVVYDEYWDNRKDELDIRYNLFNIIIPILKMIT